MFRLNFTFGTFFPYDFNSKCHLHLCCMQFLPWWLNNYFLQIECSELGALRGFLGISERRSRPNQKKTNQRVRGGWKRSHLKSQHWRAFWTDPWILGAWSWWSRQCEPQGSFRQTGRPNGARHGDPWSVTVPPRSLCWTCSAFWSNPATRKCKRWIWTTSPWSRSQRVAELFGRPRVTSSWPWRREKNGGIALRSRRGSGTWARRGTLDPRLWRFSKPWTLVRAFWWPDWNTRLKRRMTRVCKKWLELIGILFFDPPKKTQIW